MLLDAAGPGDSPPALTSSTYHSGSSRHTVYPHSLYLQHAGFSTIFACFRGFSCVFALFSAFLAPWPHLPGGTRSRNTEPGAGRPRGAATPTQAACGRRRTARAPRPGAPPPRAPGGAAPTGGSATPAQSDRRAASPAGAGRGGARPPWRVPPGRAGGTDYPEPPEARTGGAGGGA